MIRYLDEKPVNPGSGHLHGLSFNLYRTTNQLYITGQELTANQWMQPPILHQYWGGGGPPTESFSEEELALF